MLALSGPAVQERVCSHCGLQINIVCAYKHCQYCPQCSGSTPCSAYLVHTLNIVCADLQAYEERRRKKDADREAAEAAQEAEIARAAAARYSICMTHLLAEVAEVHCKRVQQQCATNAHFTCILMGACCLCVSG